MAHAWPHADELVIHRDPFQVHADRVRADLRGSVEASRTFSDGLSPGPALHHAIDAVGLGSRAQWIRVASELIAAVQPAR